MSFISPAAGVSVGASSGGGLLDTFKGMMGQAGAAGAADQSGATQQTAQQDAGPKGDGSVGMFDGVLKKALLGGVMGVGVGFIPFIPGGPILGGIVGALAGAGFGIFQNFRKIKTIQTENQAFLAAAGIQPQTEQEAQLLTSGNIKQLYADAGVTAQQTQGDPNAQQQTITAEQQQQLILQQQAAQQQAAAQQAAQQQATTQQPGTAQQSSQVMGPQQATATLEAGGADASAQTPPATQQAVTEQTSQLPEYPDLDLKNAMSEEELAALNGQVSGSNGGSTEQIKAKVEQEAIDRRKRIEDMWLKATPEQRRMMKLRRQVRQLQHQIAQLQAQLGTTQVAGASGGGAPAALSAASCGAGLCKAA